MNKLLIIPIFIVLSLSLVCADTLQEFYDTGQDNQDNVYDAFQNAQTFRVNSTGQNDTYTINKVSLFMKITGSPTDDLQVQITGLNSNSASSFTNNNTRSFGRVSVGNFTTSFAWINISMSNFTVTKGTYYAIVVNVSGAGSDGSNNYNWGIDTSSPGYVEGNGQDTDVTGTTWSNQAWDNLFRVYNQTSPPAIATTLTSPTNGSTVSTSSVNFTASYTSVLLNFTNATYFVWFSNGSLFNTTTIPLTGTGTNSSTLTINNLTIGNYMWNVQVCGTAPTTCDFEDNNFTFTFGLDNVLESFITPVLTGTTNFFQLNFTAAQGVTLSSANLIYNNTIFSPTISLSGSTYTMSTTVLAPNTKTQVNIPFYWSLEFSTGFIFNSTSRNQTVNVFGIDNCGAFTNRIINATLYDEDNRTALGGTIETLVNIYSFSNLNNPILTFNSTSTNSSLVCLSSGVLNVTNYSMSYQFRYFAPGYFTEFVYGQNITLSNSTVPYNISLYDLPQGRGQAYNLIYRDENFLPVANAIISIQRQYLPINSFLTVEAPLTDLSGQVTASLVSDNAIYNIIVTKNNQLLAVFTNQIASCASNLCTIQLNELAINNIVDDVRTSRGVNYFFTNTSNSLSFNFNTLDGNGKTLSWTVIKNDGYANTTICTDSVFSSMGAFTCTIPTLYINNTLLAYVYADGKLLTTTYFSFGPKPAGVLGGTRIILGILMYSTITLLFISNPIAIIIGSVLGIVFASSLFVIDGGSLFGTGSIIVWFVVAGAIIVWQIREANR